MKRYCWLPLLLWLWAVAGCGTTATTNGREAWLQWAHHQPPPGVHVLHGQYEQYSHWTNEYVLYLHLQVSALWLTEFVAQNHLSRVAVSPTIPPDAPTWFRLQTGYICYQDTAFNQGSFYSYDTATKEMWLYEMQL